jgi:pyruvate dehydrogenase (quinone)
MGQTAGDVLVERLIDWGVDTVFGLPGDGINGLIEAFRTRQDKIRFIQVRHEEAAAFMACGYAKFTGKLGVCIATSGPGGIHLLNGLYDAKLDGQPVLAITGLQYHDLISTYTQQDVELDKLFMDVAVYNARVMGPTHVENVTDLAIRTALSYRGVAHITIPVDFQHIDLGEGHRVAPHGTVIRLRLAGWVERVAWTDGLGAWVLPRRARGPGSARVLGGSSNDRSGRRPWRVCGSAI